MQEPKNRFARVRSTVANLSLIVLGTSMKPLIDAYGVIFAITVGVVIVVCSEHLRTNGGK